MSVKSALKTAGIEVGKFFLKLGVGYVVGKYLDHRDAKLVGGLLDAVTGSVAKPTKLQQTFQERMDELIKSKVLPTMQQSNEALRLDLEARIERGLARRTTGRK